MNQFIKFPLILILIFLDLMGLDNNPVKIFNETTIVSIYLKTGGRVVEYSMNNNNVLYIDNDGSFNGPDAGRCDIGPELIAPPRPETWFGSWELIEKKTLY